MHSAFTRPEYGLSTYTDPRDGQQPFSSPQYPYNSSSGPDTHQLPLPNQPFLPTPDRLVLAQARYQQGEDLPPLRTVPSQQAQQESPQFAKAFHSSHTSNLLSSNEEATAHEGLGQPLSASIEATFRKPTPAPARQAFPAPGSSAPNHGLGIIYMDRRQPSVQRYDYTYEPPRNCHLSAQTPNKPRFAPAPPDPATLYAMHQQGVLQGAQEQNVAEESKVFRYAHFPPETYNVTGRPSATNGFDSGAGATLARAPSFNSPHGRPIAGLPQSVTISQNQLPRYVFDDNPILTPDGPVYLPNAHRIIEQIDLPTLQNGLRHWESVLSNPSSSPQTKNEAAISCQILENRIRIVTSATQDRVSSEERRFIPPGTKSATQNAQRYERRASPQGQSRTPQPILPAARARTHSSENVISPSQALPTSVVKCSILSEELTSISPAQGKFIAVPSPPAHPMASSPVAEITSAGKNDSVPASSHATAQTAVPPIADQKKSSHPGKPAAKKARKSASAASKGKRSGGDSAKENAPQDASLLQPPLPADGPDSPAASPKTEEAGTANSAAVVSPGTTKKPASKALISTPILSEGGNEPRSGDLIWAADWNQQDHLALKLAVGPPSPEDVTYSWSDIECKQERRLMHITASISSNWVNVKIAPLQPRDYTSASDKSPDPQGSVVSCIFAEIVQKAHSQDKVPIYWISYWDVIKICEVCLDLTHRTFRLKRGHDPKPR